MSCLAFICFSALLENWYSIPNLDLLVKLSWKISLRVELNRLFIATYGYFSEQQSLQISDSTVCV